MLWGDDGRYARSTPRWRLSLVTAPTVEPVSVAEAKLHAKIDSEDEDSQVLDWIRAATRKVEHDTEMALLTQTWDLSIGAFPGYSPYTVTLPIRPVQSITHVKYWNAAGTEQTWLGTNYFLDPSTLSLGLTVNGTWPTDLRELQPGTIRFVAGYTSADLVPEDLRQAIKLLVGHFNINRQTINIGTSVTPIDLGYDALIAPYVRHLAA
jgi:uncharacterized phiE125 gp8 family phage protein